MPWIKTDTRPNLSSKFLESWNCFVSIILMDFRKESSTELH